MSYRHFLLRRFALCLTHIHLLDNQRRLIKLYPSLHCPFALFDSAGLRFSHQEPLYLYKDIRSLRYYKLSDKPYGYHIHFRSQGNKPLQLGDRGVLIYSHFLFVIFHIAFCMLSGNREKK